MQLWTETGAPYHGSVPEFCEVTNTYVRRGRAPAFGGVAEGTRVVAMSDEDAKNLDRDQALRCVLVSVIQACNSSEFPDPRVKRQILQRRLIPRTDWLLSGSGFRTCHLQVCWHSCAKPQTVGSAPSSSSVGRGYPRPATSVELSTARP